MKKTLIFASIIAAMLMGGCSIMKDKDKEGTEVKIEEIKTDIKAFLDDKYDKDFTIISVQGKEWLDNPSTYKVFAYPSDGDMERDRFEAERRKGDDGYEYSDAYFGLKIEDEYNARIKTILDKYFDKYEIRSGFDGYYFPNEFNGEKNLQDAINEGADLYGNVNVLTCPIEKEEFNMRIEAFSKEINKLKLPMLISIYNSSSEDLSSLHTNSIEYSMYRSMLVKKNMTVDLEELKVNN